MPRSSGRFGRAIRPRPERRRHFNRLIEVMLNAKEEREIEELRSRSAASRARFLMMATLG